MFLSVWYLVLKYLACWFVWFFICHVCSGTSLENVEDKTNANVGKKVKHVFTHIHISHNIESLTDSISKKKDLHDAYLLLHKQVSLFFGVQIIYLSMHYNFLH